MRWEFKVKTTKHVSTDFIIAARQYCIILILLLMVGLLWVISPIFGTWQNLINVLNQVSINGIVAVGMAFVIICAGIDISIGSMIAVASVICGAVLTKDPNAVWLAVLLSVVATSVLGFFNGLLISRFNMFPFVVTMAGMLIYRGIAYVISDGKSYVLGSESFKQIGQGKLFDAIPYSILIFAAVASLGYLLLSHTKFGRYLYAVGGNEKAANASGIKVGRIKLLTYSLIGFCAGISGIILTSRINAGQPAIGVGYELDAIAAVVIGGASLLGGVGTIGGTAVGVVIIGVINNGMNLMGVSSFYQQIVKGFIILIAVLLDSMVRNKRKN